MMFAWLALLLLLIAYGDAVHLAMVQTTQSAIARAGEERAMPARAAWIIQRWRRIEEVGAILRVAGRVAFVLLAAWAWPATDIVVLGAVVAAVIWIGASLVPAVVARHAGGALLVRTAPLLRVLEALLLPLAWIGEMLERMFARLLGASEDVEEVQEDVREEVLDALGDAEREGGIDPLSADMIENVVEFSSTTVSEVMTPRTEIEALEYTDDLSEVARFLTQVGHSRIPVYEDSIDRVIGILHVRDLVPLLGSDGAGFRLADRLRVPLIVPETKRVRDLLLQFQRSQSHLAVVVDEFGGTAGLATIEDVLEEIVGEIHDEHDGAEVEPAIVQVRPGVFKVPARSRISDVNEAIGIALPEAPDHDTIAGHVLARLGRIPAEGERIESGNCTIRVAKASPHRIEELHVVVTASAAEPPERGQSNSSPRNVDAR